MSRRITSASGAAVVQIWSTSGSQCASKAAQLSLTDGVRIELHAQGTLVVGAFAGFIDTDMSHGIDAPKSAPLVIACRVVDGIERGEEEILADERSLAVREAIRRDPGAIRADMQRLWNASRPADGRGAS